MTTMTKELLTTNEVLDLINKGQIGYMDNHDGKGKVLEGYVITEDDIICPLFRNVAFCLNPLYVGKDDMIHLSRWSCGCVVYNDRHTVEEAVKLYNEEMKEVNSVGIKSYKVFDM